MDNDLKLDLEAKAFSTKNALYFARLSEIAYNSKDEARAIIQGDGDTEHGIMGFDHFHWFEPDSAVSSASILDAVQDTEAYLVANDDVIIVVFRGTLESADWATNLKIVTRDVPVAWGLSINCNVHEGFDDGVNTVWVGCGMRDMIKSLYNEKGKKRKLFITGHSLGAALATVTAAHLAFEQNINITAIYTYGSPKIFNGPLAEEFDAKINYGIPLKDKCFRCRNNNDIVPSIPPYPYNHVGTEIYIDRFGNIGAISWVDRLLGRLTAYLRGDFGEDVNDHSTAEYIRLFKTMVNNAKKPFILKAGQLAVETAQQLLEIPTIKKSKATFLPCPGAP
ncbi:unnamed protein product [Ascophyllum nodosum]